MARSRSHELAPTLTAPRAARLYRMLSFMENTERTRAAILKHLKVDVRGFYRDLELLRTLGVVIDSNGERYKFTGKLDDALKTLPFPDPGLSLRDALQLANGRTDAHRKLKSRIDTFLGTNGKAH